MQLSSTVGTSGFSVISRVTSSRLSIVCKVHPVFLWQGWRLPTGGFRQLVSDLPVSDSCFRNGAPRKQEFGMMQMAPAQVGKVE
jgi:hypothetical protein